mmetsp:Transcript_15378/g.37769  ORF Transcript_15378/g.37769 Transcript_15378/m.37769 type:complete len:149 (-) Transcript_15378:1632-2078(-)
MGSKLVFQLLSVLFNALGVERTVSLVEEALQKHDLFTLCSYAIGSAFPQQVSSSSRLTGDYRRDDHYLDGVDLSFISTDRGLWPRLSGPEFSLRFLAPFPSELRTAKLCFFGTGELALLRVWNVSRGAGWERSILEPLRPSSSSRSSS